MISRWGSKTGPGSPTTQFLDQIQNNISSWSDPGHDFQSYDYKNSRPIPNPQSFQAKKSSSNQSPHRKNPRVLPLCTKLTKEGVTFSRQRGEEGLAEPSTNNATRTLFPASMPQVWHSLSPRHKTCSKKSARADSPVTSHYIIMWMCSYGLRERRFRAIRGTWRNPIHAKIGCIIIHGVASWSAGPGDSHVSPVVGNFL